MPFRTIPPPLAMFSTRLRRFMPAPLLVLMTIVVATVGGCGPRNAAVSGKLTIDGKPAPAGLLVEFQPQAKGSSPSVGRTDAAGSYELWQTSTKKGIATGPCIVRVSIAPPSADRGPPKLPPELEKLTIPAKYGTASSLTYDIKPGTQTIDIDIVP